MYDNNDSFRKYIDQQEISNPNLHLLESHLNLVYDPQKFKELKMETSFFKLSFKIPLNEYDFNNEKTLWYYLKNSNQ